MELFNDHFQNYKRYNVPKAQLIIADIPYNKVSILEIEAGRTKQC